MKKDKISVKLITLYILEQGFPTLINSGVHTCQPGYNAGHREQKLEGVSSIFWRISAIELHQISNNCELIVMQSSKTSRNLQILI